MIKAEDLKDDPDLEDVIDQIDDREEFEAMLRSICRSAMRGFDYKDREEFDKIIHLLAGNRTVDVMFAAGALVLGMAFRSRDKLIETEEAMLRN